jgi:arsenical pump membrane protein
VVPRALAETAALLLLAATLAFAVVRPRGLPEAVVAVPAALLTVLLGIPPIEVALEKLRSLGPTIGFLAAVLVLAELCDREGLFEAAGQRMAAGARGRPVVLLGLVFAVGSAITAVLSLDATVVLLTPVVFATALQLRLRPKPHVYACTHLANTASLLLPVSNLTNLLAFRASGLSFTRFAAIMALPWLAAIWVEWLVLRRFFAVDLVGHGEVVAGPPSRAPRYPVGRARLHPGGVRGGLACPSGPGRGGGAWGRRPRAARACFQAGAGRRPRPRGGPAVPGVRGRARHRGRGRLGGWARRAGGAAGARQHFALVTAS